MTAVCRMFVLVLAALLAAAPAAADIVITAQEVIPCSVASANAGFVRLKLLHGGVRMLETRDVREIRLSDSSRVTALAAELGLLGAAPDSGWLTPLPDVRVEHVRLRSVLKPLAGDARSELGIDTLPQSASQAAITARCWDLRIALLACGVSTDSAALLIYDVNCEAAALRRVPSGCAGQFFSVPCVGLLGAAVGTTIGWAVYPPVGCDPGGGPPGCAVGCLLGLVTGYCGREVLRIRALARHRSKVNDMVRRFNRIVAAAP